MESNRNDPLPDAIHNFLTMIPSEALGLFAENGRYNGDSSRLYF